MNEQAALSRKLLPPVFRMAVLAGIKASVQLHARLGGDVPYTRDYISRFGRFAHGMDDLPKPLTPQPLPFEVAL